MDASTDVLAAEVRAKRVAIDNDLELLRVRLHEVDPRHRFDVKQIQQIGRRALPVAAGGALAWMWARRRRRVSSLDHLLAYGLNDLYRIEQQIVPALARMRAKASDPELKRAFEQHQHETDAHVERLERVFRAIGTKPKRGSAESVKGIIASGEKLKAKADPDVRDAWLIATAQRVEHLEIATYGTVRTYAETLGYTYAADLLQQTLDEERVFDEKLTNLAERFINPRSLHSSRTA